MLNAHVGAWWEASAARAGTRATARAGRLLTMTDDEPPRTPRPSLPNLTKIVDAGTGRDLLEVEGMLTLPIGAHIELGSAMDP